MATPHLRKDKSKKRQKMEEDERNKRTGNTFCLQSLLFFPLLVISSQSGATLCHFITLNDDFGLRRSPPPSVEKYYFNDAEKAFQKYES